MTWKGIDFHSLAVMDKPFYEELCHYLEEKESQLCHEILAAIQDGNVHSDQPTLEITSLQTLHLDDVIERMDRTVRQEKLKGALLAPDKQDALFRSFSQMFWSYVESLQTCVTELYQELALMGLEQWRFELLSTVDAIKIMLMHRLEDAIWSIKRIEKLLNEYSEKSSFWSKFKHLDPQLIQGLSQSQTFLIQQHKEFTKTQTTYFRSMGEYEIRFQKFKDCPVFNTLDSEAQEKFKRIYFYLKLWKANLKQEFIAPAKVSWALRSFLAPERVYELYRSYLEHIYRAVFDFSRRIKDPLNHLDDEHSDEALDPNLLNLYEIENQKLLKVIQSYRGFVLRTDANPYVRTRMGFTEWVVGPEPESAKKLFELVLKAETQATLIANFKQQYQTSSHIPLSEFDLIQKSIDKRLHTISQPLISQAKLARTAEDILNQLDSLNELSSSQSFVVNFIGETLSKLMRADWRYQAIFDLPKFHEIYHIHEGIKDVHYHRSHKNRLNFFEHTLNQIKNWNKESTLQKHLNEVENHINDIRSSFQTLFMHVQKQLEEKSEGLDDQKEDVNFQLLQYRYIFGKFFHSLNLNEPSQKYLRNQFLFVDQYFESIESKLYTRST